MAEKKSFGSLIQAAKKSIDSIDVEALKEKAFGAIAIFDDNTMIPKITSKTKEIIKKSIKFCNKVRSMDIKLLYDPLLLTK